MQFFKGFITFFIVIFSSYSVSNNMVELIVEHPQKKFDFFVATHTPGQYIEYNENLLSVRLYDNQGLKSEFSVELNQEYSNSSHQVFFDAASNSIWITNSLQDESGQWYLKVEQFVFNAEQFTGEYKILNLPNDIFGEVQGFNNNNIYLLMEDTSTGNLTYNFAEYDVSSDIIPQRTLSFDESFSSRISPNGQFFVTNEGIIDLSTEQMRWVDSGINANQAPYFLDDDTVFFQDNDFEHFIGSINDSIVSKAPLLLPNNSANGQFENSIITYFENNVGLVSSYSIDKINDVWSISNIEVTTDVNAGSHNYRRTVDGGLINENVSFSYDEGAWLQYEELLKGYEYDGSYVFVSNMSDILDNDLYAISTGDINTLRSLELNENANYQWRDIADITVQSGELILASKYNNHLYLFYSDGLSIFADKNERSTTVIVLNITGEYISTTKIPYLDGLSLSANIYDGYIYVTASSVVLKCTIEAFYCDDITPSAGLRGDVIYHQNNLYHYNEIDNELFYYNTLSGSGWELSLFEIPVDGTKGLYKFGDQLRLENELLVLNGNGEIDSLTGIIRQNTGSMGEASSYFKNNKIACNLRLTECANYDEENVLFFNPINAEPNLTSIYYKQITGTPFFYNSLRAYESIEVFKIKDDILFPEIKNIMPAEIADLLQGERFSISFNDYFNNVNYYSYDGPEYSMYTDQFIFNDFIADSNGDLELTLINEHTWQELTIPITTDATYYTSSTYTGYNDDFYFKVPPTTLRVKDINDPPWKREGKSLTYTVKEWERLEILLHDVIYDPEREGPRFTITNLPLPDGFRSVSGLSGVIEKNEPVEAGTYYINVTATDRSIEQLSSDFIITVNITGSDVSIPVTVEEPSSSGGSLSGFLLILLTILWHFRERLA